MRFISLGVGDLKYFSERRKIFFYGKHLTLALVKTFTIHPSDIYCQKTLISLFLGRQLQIDQKMLRTHKNRGAPTEKDDILHVSDIKC